MKSVRPKYRLFDEDLSHISCVPKCCLPIGVAFGVSFITSLSRYALISPSRTAISDMDAN